MATSPLPDEPLTAADYVVHYPLPSALRADKGERTALLEGLEWLVLVGSPARARMIARAAVQTRSARVGCYCDLTQPGRNEFGREFALWVVRFKSGPVVGIASHGVGLSGVEIALSEIPALVSVATEGRDGALRGVIRSGTRGTLAPVPLGCVALSTTCYDEMMNAATPDAALVGHLRAAAAKRGMTRVPEGEIAQRAAAGWGQNDTNLLIEGKGIATTFFWEGQGRPRFIPAKGGGRQPSDEAQSRARAKLLSGWYDAGIAWIEMEDYTVHKIAASLGYASAAVGAVIASRRTADGRFQVDYDHDAHVRSEMIPTDLALDAILLAAKEAR